MRRVLGRALAAVTVMALLPVAVFAGGALAGGNTSGAGPAAPLHAADAGVPTPDAVHRASASGLFASFSWDGVFARGSFVQFGFDAKVGTVAGFEAKAGPVAVPLLESVSVVPFVPLGTPAAVGPTFHVLANGLTLTAHDDPMTLLEYRTTGQAHTVTVRLLGPTSNITAQVHPSTWPAATVSFSVGASRGSLLLGAGTINVSENVVTANLTASDVFVLKTLPATVPEPSDRESLLNAFAMGRIFAEFALVSEEQGAWAESSAHYRLDLSAVSSSVDPGQASILLASVHGKGGLLLVAFDPATMPVGPGHRIVVTANGNTLPESSLDLARFLTASESSGPGAFVRLAGNATTLAIFLPTVSATTVTISSTVPPPPPIDLATALAMVAALAVVGYAASDAGRQGDLRRLRLRKGCRPVCRRGEGEGSLVRKKPPGRLSTRPPLPRTLPCLPEGYEERPRA